MGAGHQNVLDFFREFGKIICYGPHRVGAAPTTNPGSVSVHFMPVS